MNPATSFSIVDISFHPVFRLGGKPVTTEERARYLNRAYAVPWTKYGRGTREAELYLAKLKDIFRGENSMALTLIGMDAFTQARGKVATEPKIAISDKGQVRFNRLAAEKFGEAQYLQIAMDLDKRAIIFVPTNEAKNANGANAKVGRAMKEDGVTPKDGSCYVNMGGVLKEHFKGYDLAKAGNQVFPVTPYEHKTKKGTTEYVSLVIPATTPAAKPKTERKRKAKNGNGTASTASTAPVAPTAPAGDDDDLTIE